MSERTCEGCGTSMHSPYAADQRCTLCDECAVAMPLEAELSALRSDLQRALSERDEARAQAAVMRRALEWRAIEDTIDGERICGECDAIGARPEMIEHKPECPLSSSAGRALLEDMEGLRAENEHLENERDIARGDAESTQERERNALSLLASVRESLNAESAVLRARLERAETEARTLREVHISPAEVRRAVEEETERIARLLRTQASHWEPDTPVRHALEVAAVNVRSRGKDPEK